MCMVLETKKLFDKYLDIWQENVHGNMFGVDSRRFSYDELVNTPQILSLRGVRDKSFSDLGNETPRIEMSIDSSNFPYLFRGIAGPGHIRYGGLGCGSINCNISDGARSPPTNKLIEEYAKLGYLTTGHFGSKGTYLSKNPLVAFSGDKSGPYATPDGLLMIVSPSGLQTEETNLTVRIDEIVAKKVPIENVELIYINEKNSEDVLRTNALKSKFKTHAFSDSDLTGFRKDGLMEIIYDTASSPDELFENKYASKEITKLNEGIEIFKNWIANSGKFLDSGAYRVDYEDKYHEWRKDGMKGQQPEKMFVPYIGVDGWLFKSRSIQKFKDKTIDQIERLETVLDNSSFSNEKYPFINELINQVNTEDPAFFKHKNGWFVRELTDKEEERYNFQDIDRELSDYLFRTKYAN